MRASGTTKRPISAASTPMPPASANEKGMNPASRRDCDSETTSENGVKSHGTSVIAKTASEPPTDVGGPAAARREDGERDQEQRRDRDRARSGRTPAARPRTGLPSR
jgi:hypothetical protein